ncbi:MAG: hypothetical protein JSW59_01650 [Phycisphaerales bacterium]|nr:MAG: hypothetical protein JSW59_01650 [Phycisphaerales bacterium]
MKSSTTILLVAIGALVSLTLVVASGGTGNDGDVIGRPTEVGRFALESGQYLAPSHAAARPLPGIFKIDTATGKVWKYVGRVEGKEKIEEWVAISK